MSVNLQAQSDSEPGLDLIEVALLLRRRWKTLLGWPLAAALAASAYVLLVTPTFTARTTFVPPQQATNSSAAAALGSLGGNIGVLAGVAGAGLRTPADQYVALLNSDTVADNMVEKFKLFDLYEVEKRFEVRRELRSRVAISLGRRDGLISVEVSDRSPERAAAMANQYVDELRKLTARLALTEAQQRRQFFEQQLVQAKERLTAAQQALMASGFSGNNLKVEPRTAAEAYAKLRADLTLAELRLQAIRTQLSESAPEVQAQAAIVAGLRQNVANLEQSDAKDGGPDYISKFREFKYREALFESMARQFELARVDESREGAIIQVIDPALPPDFRSKPARKIVVLGVTLAAFLLTLFWMVGQLVWQGWRARPEIAARFRRDDAPAP